MLPAQWHQHMQALAAAGLEPRVSPISLNNARSTRAACPTFSQGTPSPGSGRTRCGPACRWPSSRRSRCGIRWHSSGPPPAPPSASAAPAGRMPRIQGLRQQTRAGIAASMWRWKNRSPPMPDGARTSETGRPFQIRSHQRRGLDVVTREIALGQAARGIDDALRVRQPARPTRMRLAVFPLRLFRSLSWHRTLLSHAHRTASRGSQPGSSRHSSSGGARSADGRQQFWFPPWRPRNRQEHGGHNQAAPL